MLKSAALLLAACALCLSQARASTIQDNFTVTGSGISASGTLTLTPTANAGVDDITNITGTFSTTNSGGFSGAITGLNPGSYSATNPTSEPLSVFDNLFYPGAASASCSGYTTAGLVDYCGLDFLVAGGYEANVYANNVAQGYLISDGLSGGSVYLDSNAPVSFTVTASAVPEPSTWMLTATGLLGAFGAARRSLRRG